PGRWQNAPVMMEAFDALLDPIEARMESWAAFVAIDEAYEEALYSAWPERRNFAAILDECLAALDRFDEALKGEIEHFAIVSRTALLNNWRRMLAEEYRAALPWWLDGTLERIDEQVAEHATTWQPRRPGRTKPGEQARLDFSSDPEVVRLVAEAYRLAWGHQAHPGVAVETSLGRPLPAQRIAL